MNDLIYIIYESLEADNKSYITLYFDNHANNPDNKVHFKPYECIKVLSNNSTYLIYINDTSIIVRLDGGVLDSIDISDPMCIEKIKDLCDEKDPT